MMVTIRYGSLEICSRGNGMNKKSLDVLQYRDGTKIHSTTEKCK